jgi:hypothetical protein
LRVRVLTHCKNEGSADFTPKKMWGDDINNGAETVTINPWAAVSFLSTINRKIKF